MAHDPLVKRWQCLSCGGTYTTPGGGAPYTHRCPSILDPDQEDVPPYEGNSIRFPCERDESPAFPVGLVVAGRRRQGRGRRAIGQGKPPPLPPEPQRPCQNKE